MSEQQERLRRRSVIPHRGLLILGSLGLGGCVMSEKYEATEGAVSTPAASLAGRKRSAGTGCGSEARQAGTQRVRSP